MTVTPIRNENDHKNALARIEQLFDAEPGTPEGDELEVLITLVDYYEVQPVFRMPFALFLHKTEPGQVIIKVSSAYAISRSRKPKSSLKSWLQNHSSSTRKNVDSPS